jgi:hypothetical protein
MLDELGPDFMRTRREVNLNTDKQSSSNVSFSDLITISTCFGHASNGHGEFKQANRELSLNEFLKSLEEIGEISSAKDVRTTASSHIDSVKSLLDELLDIYSGNKRKSESPLNLGRRRLKLENLIVGGKLFELGSFSEENFSFDDIEIFLKGFYMASMMDSAKFRKQTLKTFPLNYAGGRYSLGYGSAHVGNLDEIRRLGIPLESLNTKPRNDDEVKELYDLGALVNIRGFNDWDSRDYDESLFTCYVRENMGFGCSDDMSLVTIATMLGNGDPKKMITAYIGASICDTVDTLDKLSAKPIRNGADEFLGNYLAKRYKDVKGQKIVDDTDICKVIYNGAKSNRPALKVSSSVRYFHQEQGKLGTVFKAYQEFLEIRKILGEGLKVGFERKKMTKVTKAMLKRLEQLKELN